MHKKFLSLLQYAIAAALFIWVLSFVPVDSWSNLTGTSLIYLFPAFLGVILCQTLAAFRLYLFISSLIHNVSFCAVFKATWLGYFCSYFLPASIGGDVVKLIWIARKYQKNDVLLAGMVAERVISLFVTATVALLFFLTLPTTNIEIDIARFYMMAALIALAAVLCSVIVYCIRRYTKLVPEKVIAYIHGARQALSHWKRARKPIVRAVALSALILLISGLAVLTPLLRSAGVSISPLHSIGCVSLVTLLTLIPVTINGIGVYEAGLVGVLALLGCPAESAAEAAVLMRLLSLIAALPGAYWLWRFTRGGAGSAAP